MSSPRTFVGLFSFLLIMSVSLAQQRQEYEPEWDALVKHKPSIEGSLFYLLPTPCPLFSLEGTTSGEPMVLMVRGDDLSDQGGSSTGCGIPNDATALMIQVRMESSSDVPVRLKIWSTESQIPKKAVLESITGGSDSTMMVIPLGQSPVTARGEFQFSSSDWAVLEGDAVGFFSKSNVQHVPGSGVLIMTESTSDTYNDFFGYNAGLNATGYYNAFFGKNAGNGNTAGMDNTGSSNSFFGQESGFLNTSGDRNSFYGRASGFKNTSGSDNVFVGNWAGYSNTSGSANTYAGSKAGENAKGTYNSFFGRYAGNGATDGEDNTGNSNSFFGYAAGYLNTTGYDNTFFGDRAGYSNTDAHRNSYFGTEAGDNATAGHNSYFGFRSGYGATIETPNDGWHNAFFGFESGYRNTTGYDNTYIGYKSGHSNTDGDRNTSLGYKAGDSVTVEGNNTLIGAKSDIDPGTDPETSPVENATAIGYEAEVSQSNSLVLGSISGVNGATDSVNVGIGTTAPSASLHVSRSDSTVKMILAESTGPEAVRNLMDLKNNGMAQFRLIDTSPNGDAWQFSNTDNNLNISLQGSGSQEFLIENDGDVWINNGTVMVTSYRASKENFQNLDTEEILRRVADLPLSDWNYKKDNDSVRHIGPVSEDFYEFFGYGEDDQHIAPNDLAGVNTAAIQGLYQRLLEKDQEIQRLRGKVFELESLKQDLVDLSKLVADIRMGKLKN
jgi:hypothetical protein